MSAQPPAGPPSTPTAPTEPLSDSPIARADFDDEAWRDFLNHTRLDSIVLASKAKDFARERRNRKIRPTDVASARELLTPSPVLVRASAFEDFLVRGGRFCNLVIGAFGAALVENNLDLLLDQQRPNGRFVVGILLLIWAIYNQVKSNL